jgi:hypothetical protein
MNGHYSQPIAARACPQDSSEGAGKKTPAFPTYTVTHHQSDTPRRAEKRPHRAFRQDSSEGADKKTPAFPTDAV